MNKDIMIGVLAYNMTHTSNISEDLSSLGIDFVIINDYCTDDVLKLVNLKEKYNFGIINNDKNIEQESLQNSY